MNRISTKDLQAENETLRAQVAELRLMLIVMIPFAAESEDGESAVALAKSILATVQS